MAALGTSDVSAEESAETEPLLSVWPGDIVTLSGALCSFVSSIIL